MNYEHLKYFVMAAKEEHFIRSAEKLNITQSTLSRAIQNLEYELGVPLFQKFGRNVKLTSFGNTFLRYVEDGLSMIDAGKHELHRMTDHISGMIRIDSIFVYSHYELPQLIYGFSALYPDVQFSNYQFPSRDIISHILSGDADIGFVSGYIDFDREYPRIAYETVRQEEVVLIVSSTHRLAGRPSASLHEIEGEPFVTFTEQSGFHYLSRGAFARAGVPFRPSVVATDDMTVCTFVEEGLGVALVGREVAEQFHRVHIIQIEGGTLLRDLTAVWKRGASLSPAASLFLDYVFKHRAELRGKTAP